MRVETALYLSLCVCVCVSVCFMPLLPFFRSSLFPVAALPCAGPAMLRGTRPLLLPKTVKPNPFTTESGQFDRSFEKTVSSLEQKLPFRQHHFLKGSMYDRGFGEEGAEEMKEAAREDLEGREPERPAARQVRSYFTGDDLSPEALHVHSPRLKAAQLVQRQYYDKSILKTSSEPKEYYYKEYSLREKRFQAFACWACVALCGAVAYVGWRRLVAYMGADRESFAIDGEGNVRVLVRE